MLYSSFNRAADSALIWQYGPFAQFIVVGITAGDPQPDARMGPLTWDELSHDVIVASHFSPVVGIYNLEGSVHRGLLPRLLALDWNQPVIISADQNRQMTRFRALVQAGCGHFRACHTSRWRFRSPTRGISCVVAGGRLRAPGERLVLTDAHSTAHPTCRRFGGSDGHWPTYQESCVAVNAGRRSRASV